uniref:UBX domain protein 7 n=1 Tax=Eptatretus burgeri TaxID=7764 RepID=A0A8C4NJ88_EPTBU
MSKGRKFEIKRRLCLYHVGRSGILLHHSVRAPIPQKQEVLVPPSLYPVPKRRKISHSVFDGFRDFQSESAMAAVSASGGFSGGGVTGERRSLADLFRPPVELIHRGGFMSARLAAEQRHCWLLVNIQDASDFSSQCLNRDVWSASSVKEALKEHFVFWQVYRDTEEGERFCQFYKVSSLPHISILEPATGEKLAEFVASDPTTFLDLATDFLSHHDLADARPSQSAAPVQVNTSCDKSASSFTKSKWEEVKCTMPDCVPREECSGNSAEVGAGSKDVWRNIEEDKADVGDVKTMAVKSGGCITLRLRYPDDSREQKSFLSSAPLQELFSHVTLRGFPLSRFDIVGTFPALRVSAICPRSPLSASLYHNHTLFIHEKLS